MRDGFREALLQRFGDQMRDDLIERTIHGYDVAALPGLVERMIRNIPDAVVQPLVVADVVDLVRLAREHGVPLVPRGGATSGYGGSIPARGGVVVSFRRMSRVLSVDREAGTVTVEAGTIWSEVERSLAPHGLALRTYPTSAPGSTVAGWVAEGGTGIGGYEYGEAIGSVESVRAVTASGEVRDFSGDELGLVSRAEGTTGLIVEVTLRTRPLEADRVIGAYFGDLNQLVGAIEEIGRRGLPVWNVSLATAGFVARRHEALADGNPHDAVSHAPADREQRPVSGQHSALFVYPVSRAAAIDPELAAIIADVGGEMMPEDESAAEWQDRFYPMRLKRLGPTLIPSEAIVPLSSLAAVISEGERRLPGIVMEGMLAGPDHVTLLCFLLADERTPAYTASFAKSLVMMDIALRHGARPYSVGLYFQDDAQAALGREHLDALAAFKAQTDPSAILNPGKIYPGSAPVLLRTAMGAARTAASAGKGLIDIAAALLPSQPPTGDRKGLPEAVVRGAYSCARCGYCVPECTLMSGTGWESSSPRGKYQFIQRYLEGDLRLEQAQVNNLLMCTTCKRCDPVCQVQLPIMDHWDALRPVMVRDMSKSTFPAFEMMSASMGLNLNIWAEDRERRDQWVPEEVRPSIVPEGPVGYWAGCTASFIEQDIARNAARILHEGGVDFAYLGQDEACCGIPMAMAGLTDQFLAAARHNLEQLAERGIKDLIMSCPGCWVAFSHYYPEAARQLGMPYEIRIRHITEVTAELVAEGRLKWRKPVDRTLTWHDSCHIGRHGGIY